MRVLLSWLSVGLNWDTTHSPYCACTLEPHGNTIWCDRTFWITSRRTL
jgi:hypothetical protein